MKRIIGASALALVLAVSGASVPAMAAEPAKTVTLKGHIYDLDGDPIKGVTVAAGSPGDTSASFYEEVTTDKNGRYEIHIRAGKMGMFFENSWFTKYMPVSKSTFTAKAGKSYRINRTLVEQSQISGTVRDLAGTPQDSVDIIAYDAETGKKLPGGATNNGQSLEGGRYHMAIGPGEYKLRILDLETRKAFWLGGFASRAESPTITTERGEKTTGVNVTLPYVATD